MPDTVLVLGASGRMGRNAAEAFSAAGWEVRRFDRAHDTLVEAAQGADVIFNGWNPPYSEWAETVPRLTQEVIAAARATGATVMIPGNVYVFGRGSPEVLTPETPHRASNPLGRIRIDMEATYRAANIPVILLRAGDFLDTRASGNWFDKVITRGIRKGRLSYPGNPAIPHAWAYLPDLAAAFVALARRRGDLERFTDLAFPGFTLTGAELGAACGRALGQPVRVDPMSWLPIHLARPFWREAKHLLEMRYLWDMPHRLDGTALAKAIGEVPSTPVDTAMERVLAPLAG